MRRRRNPELIGGVVAANGAVTAGEVSVLRPSTGVYDLTFPPDFTLSTFVVTAGTGSNHVITWINRTGSSIRVIAYTASTGAGADVAFSYLATGAK